MDYRNSTIAIIICYIGKLPWYFSYFLHTCKYNSSIDFFVITDNAMINGLLPANVRVINLSQTEISKIASERLHFNVAIITGYKLCDFKPAYGFLFFEMIKDYDYWGYADIDVVFGDIRSFITDQILIEHDLITVRHDYLTGYFQVFRNNKKMRTLFMRSKDYKKVFQSDSHFCFDETNFQFEGFAEGKNYDEIPSEVESMMHVVKKAEKENHIRAFFDFLVVEGVPGKIKWEKGHLFYSNKYEILLYHLIHFKKRYSPKKIPSVIPDIFTISKNAIYHQRN